MDKTLFNVLLKEVKDSYKIYKPEDWKKILTTEVETTVATPRLQNDEVSLMGKLLYVPTSETEPYKQDFNGTVEVIDKIVRKLMGADRGVSNGPLDIHCRVMAFEILVEIALSKEYLEKLLEKYDLGHSYDVRNMAKDLQVPYSVLKEVGKSYDFWMN